jgi:tripartite-type tricarboxylate transporter receptor subunit TctC
MRAAQFVAACIAYASLGVSVSAHAQSSYPSKPIRFIVPYMNGGLGDTFGRAMAESLGQRLGQTVVVDNRPGASQVIAMEATAKAPPDGHTIAYGTQSGMVFMTVSRKSLPYDPLKDFAPIGMLFDTPFYLIVHPSVPATNVLELIAHIKANPGKLSYASIGVASGQHLTMEFFRSRVGDLDIVHVPYKGSAAAALDITSGRVQVMFEGPATTANGVRTGKLRVLASSGSQRTRAMPQVPTVMESGVPGFSLAAWFGLQAPAGVPRPVIERLNQEVSQWLRMPETRDKVADKFSLDLMTSTPEEMGERIAREIPIFTKLMRAAGIEPE